MAFAGVMRAEEFRNVTRAHVIAWRDDLLARTPKLRIPMMSLGHSEIMSLAVPT
jgi:hypothetical protein